MQAIINTLVPVFLLIALGVFLARIRFFQPGVVAGLNHLTYWIALPVLVFVSLAKADHAQTEVLRLLTVLILGTLTTMGAAYATAYALGVSSVRVGTFVQASFRGNIAYVGLPIMLTLPNLPRTAGVLMLAPLLILYNAGGVATLLVSRATYKTGFLPTVGREIGRNPILLGSLAGGIFYLLGGQLLPVVERTLDPLGRMALPLALLCIGVALVTTPLQGARLLMVVASLIKTVLSPLIGFLLGRLLGLSPGEMMIVLVLMACPAATASHTMVKVLGGDEALAAGSIVLSTLFSAGSLALIVAITSHWS